MHNCNFPTKLYKYRSKSIYLSLVTIAQNIHKKNMDIKVPGICNVVAFVLLLAGAFSPGWLVFDVSGLTIHVGLFYVVGYDLANLCELFRLILQRLMRRNQYRCTFIIMLTTFANFFIFMILP